MTSRRLKITQTIQWNGRESLRQRQLFNEQQSSTAGWL